MTWLLSFCAIRYRRVSLHERGTAEVWWSCDKLIGKVSDNFPKRTIFFNLFFVLDEALSLENVLHDCVRQCSEKQQKSLFRFRICCILVSRQSRELSSTQNTNKAADSTAIISHGPTPP